MTEERKKNVQTKLAEEQQRLTGLEQRWQNEKTLVEQILDLRAKLRDVVNKVEGTQSKLEFLLIRH